MSQKVDECKPLVAGMVRLSEGKELEHHDLVGRFRLPLSNPG